MRKFSVFKLIAALCLVTFLTFCALGCDNKSEGPSYEGEGMVATVIEAHDSYLLIAPDKDAPEARSSDRFTVPNYFEGRVRKGDTVVIKHNGMIQETYPASFNRIFEMILVGDDGINESVIID